jgi:alpha-1,6-mannosyltransferase
MRQQGTRLAIIGAILEIIWIAICRLGPLREQTACFLVLILCTFIFCIWSYFRFPIQTGKMIYLILGFALLFRITVLFAPPFQSEDVYPPLSQILFWACFQIFGSSVTAMKAVFSILEFLAVLIVWRLLILWEKSVQTLILMAWNPFFIFEFSHSGHSDSAMVFLIVLSIYLLSRSRRGWAAVSYAGAVLAKLHPALWFPLFVRRIGWKPMTAGFAAGAALVLVYFNIETWLSYLNSLGLYFRLFEFNASIHYFIRFIGRLAFQESWDKLIGPYLAAALLLIVNLIVWKFPVRHARDLLHAGFWLMTADLCLATTVHPWYLSWAALALPFFPYAFMVYWTGICFLSYIAYSYHPVYEPAWVLLVEYLPVYGLMAWEIWKRRPLMEVWLQRRDQ